LKSPENIKDPIDSPTISNSEKFRNLIPGKPGQSIHGKEKDLSDRITPTSMEVPNEYRLIRKFIALYPLFTLPIGTAIARYKQKISRRYQTPLEQ